jgi:sulfate adenylyltransferase subunit 2
MNKLRQKIPAINIYGSKNNIKPWNVKLLMEKMCKNNTKAVERHINASDILPKSILEKDLLDENCNKPKLNVLNNIIREYKRKRKTIYFLQIHRSNNGKEVIFINDYRLEKHWIWAESTKIDENFLLKAIESFIINAKKSIILIPSFNAINLCRNLSVINRSNLHKINKIGTCKILLEIYHENINKDYFIEKNSNQSSIKDNKLSHLDSLESESINIMREVAAESNKPVILYSIGKDSAVMLHIAKKAFYPSKIPFPILHVDTRWKFREMYDFRSSIIAKENLNFIIHTNGEGIKNNINPFDHGSQIHTDIMKTQALKQALDKYGFDVAFGGARRDEEKSRAKERIFSFRNSSHGWDPKNQKPEIWNLYNTKINKGESIRVFPLSNWTELEIWQYIYREKIPIVPLYFSKSRPVIERNGMLTMVDDDRIKLLPEEKIQFKNIRFRTLGCYPLTGAIESDANDVESIILELLEAKNSEREGRLIDKDASDSMEVKKLEGYF